MENITLGGKTREVTDEQLEAIEKILAPKLQMLREGDYGLDGCGRFDPDSRIIIDGRAWHKGGNDHIIDNDCRQHFTWYGNIFDNLKQYAEDAEKIETTCSHTKCRDYVTVKITNNGQIHLMGGHLCLDCAIKHAHAIIQVALTAKRKGK